MSKLKKIIEGIFKEIFFLRNFFLKSKLKKKKKNRPQKNIFAFLKLYLPKT